MFSSFAIVDPTQLTTKTEKSRPNLTQSNPTHEHKRLLEDGCVFRFILLTTAPEVKQRRTIVVMSVALNFVNSYCCRHHVVAVVVAIVI